VRVRAARVHPGGLRFRSTASARARRNNRAWWPSAGAGRPAARNSLRPDARAGRYGGSAAWGPLLALPNGVTLRVLHLTGSDRLWMARKRVLLLLRGGQVGRRGRRSLWRARGAGLVGADTALARAFEVDLPAAFEASGRVRGHLEDTRSRLSPGRGGVGVAGAANAATARGERSGKTEPAKAISSTRFLY
jgi:hypothetical protein